MSLTHLSDLDLVSAFQDTLLDERYNLVTQLEHIMELDRRKLFFHYSSLRSYLVSEFNMEEWLAERKIRAARLMKRAPFIANELRNGRLNLTLLELAQGCAFREKLSDAELAELLRAIAGMSVRRAQREIAALYPQSLATPRDRIMPISEDLSEVRFVAGQDLLDKLDEIKGLLAHSHPGITFAELIDVLATEYRDRHHPEAKAKRQKKTDPVKTPTAPGFSESVQHFFNRELKRVN